MTWPNGEKDDCVRGSSGTWIAEALILEGILVSALHNSVKSIKVDDEVDRLIQLKHSLRTVTQMLHHQPFRA